MSVDMVSIGAGFLRVPTGMEDYGRRAGGEYRERVGYMVEWVGNGRAGGESGGRGIW